jgi:twitching motility protein PilT
MDQLSAADILKEAVRLKASDVHIKIPSPPVFRIDGKLVNVVEMPNMTVDYIQKLYEEITTQNQRSAFDRDCELDFAYSLTGLARFRVNVQRQRGSLSIAFRIIDFVPPTMEDLELPKILCSLALKPKGFIIVTGPTGSGKSTTLAGMVNYLNSQDSRTIVTIEDPIEYLYKDNKCIITQRELGEDTRSFATALRSALRHDPDVIVVGEMRDAETMATALAAAETGHLVLGTLHTVDAAQTIDRIIDMFPSSQQRQIRFQLSMVVEAILCQTLLPRASGKGRVAAFEIMLANPAIRHLIRDDKTYELENIMQMSIGGGMQLLDQHLADLVNRELIFPHDAFRKSMHPERLNRLIESRFRLASCDPAGSHFEEEAPRSKTPAYFS